VLNSSFWKENAEEIQGVMLQIEKQARLLTEEEIKNTTKNMEEDKAQTYRCKTTGSSATNYGRRRKFDGADGGEEGKPPSRKMPKSPHPAEAVTTTEERISCSRCLRSILRTNASSVIRGFWEAECVDRAKQNTESSKGRLCSMTFSQNYKETKGADIAKEWLKEQKKHHGGNGELLWSGEGKAPVTCTACGLIWSCAGVHGIFFRERHHQFEKCTGNMERAMKDQRELKEYAKEIAKLGKGHEWEWPADGILVCKKCGVYLTKKADESRKTQTIPFKQCGSITLRNEWRGIQYHEDPKWYQPDIPFKL
jgi:hypothetical protein